VDRPQRFADLVKVIVYLKEINDIQFLVSVYNVLVIVVTMKLSLS